MDIDIRQNTGIFETFRGHDYTRWGALSEFIDNALDSYHKMDSKTRPKKCCIKITADLEEITISDNAGGIKQADWNRIFKVGERAKDNSGLSEFGWGMKIAACWLSNLWSVESLALEETKAISATFKVEEIINSQSESIPSTSKEANASDHYTIVSLKELLRPIDDASLEDIKKNLPLIYRKFIREETLDLYVNEELLGFAEHKYLNAPKYNSKKEPVDDIDIYWRKTITIALKSGDTVKGCAGILSTGSTKDAGLELFRRGRLITGRTKEDGTYRPIKLYARNSAAAQRIVGELHMDDFNVNATKDAIDFGDQEADFIEKLKEALNAGKLTLIRQAKNFLANKHKSWPPPGEPIPPEEPGEPEGPEGPEEPERPRPPTKPITIKWKEDIAQKLEKLDNDKLIALYHSLVNVSCKDHPSLTVVGVWSFLESLTSAAGRQDGTLFYNFMFNDKKLDGENRMSIKTRKAKAKYLYEEGNTTKHHEEGTTFDSRQIISNMDVISKDICRICDRAIEEKKK